MAWAIFHVESNWRRSKASIYSFNAKASPEPQSRPKDFIAYCVGKGWATEVPAPRRDVAKRASKKS